MLKGTTFSYSHTGVIGLDPQKALTDLLEVNFDILRLGCYWSKIERTKGDYDFSVVKKQLELCEKHKQKVVMTIGMKAPRWPEFYVPDWVTKDTLEQSVLQFVQKCIEELGSFSCITHWQVENEPLDPSGPTNEVISEDLLTKEINLVRRLDSKRPIVLNVWGNELTKRGCFDKLVQKADIIGTDIYYKTPSGRFLYRGPSDSDQALRECFTAAGKPVWITELQAEPWEHNEIFFKGDNPRSINSKQLEKNVQQAISLQPQAILLWGAEYWLWRKNRGDDSLWQAAVRFFKKPTP